MRFGQIVCKCGNAKVTSRFECDACKDKKIPVRPYNQRHNRKCAHKPASGAEEKMSDPSVILTLAKLTSNLVKACNSGIRLAHLDSPVSAAVDFLLGHRAEIESAMKRAGAKGIDL